jgi:flagellar hook-associated protein 2
MAVSTNLISGLTTGFDWSGMIEQLIALEHERVDLVSAKKTEYESRLTEWQSVNTKLLAVKTAAAALSGSTAFDVFRTTLSSDTSTAAADLLSISTDDTAASGTYSLKVTQLAQSEKISSASFAGTDTALSIAGDILISGKVVNIVETDTLADIKDKINAVNTGSNPSDVTASIVSHSSTDYHLVLTSDETGAEGISVLEASSGNVLNNLGLITSATAIKNTTSDGAMSDSFADSNTAAGTLLGLTSPPGDISVTIGGQAVTINLAVQSITTIAANIDALAGVSASVVSDTVDGETKYRIDISGTTSFVDDDNVLQSLGILEGTYGAVAEVLTGGTVNTTDGITAISSTTQWDQIFGANVQSGTSFTLTGRNHDGTAVSGSFTISSTSAQVGELLTYIEDTLFSGTVTATIDAAGKIQITDNATGDSRLELDLITNNPAGGSLDFGTVSTSDEGRSMQLAAGADAEIELDNVVLTSASNTITDAISGVSIDLKGVSDSTTVTLKIERDTDSIRTKIQGLVTSYNAVMSYISTQFSYDEDAETTGGVLFGDGTLSSVKSDLISIVTQSVTGLSSDCNRLSLIGIAFNDQAQLMIDSTVLTDALKTNFDEVKKLFVATGSASNSLFQYVSHTSATEGGSYAVSITQAATRTTVTGSAALAGTLSAPETISIIDYSAGREAQVSLTAGMDLDDVVNAVNSELAKSYTEVLEGSVETGYAASTSFSEISGADDGDVITFSGKRPNGLGFSSSYTVSTDDALQDLLTAVEDAFEEDVTVTLSAAGKLVVTDKMTGDSLLEFTMDTSSVSGLDFGTIAASQEGRNAIAITASKTGDNHLLLTHNDYGTGHPIVVSETGGTELGLNGASQVYGVNVAGTINGATATGGGQSLTLNAEGNGADGLSILYTGTSATSATFNMTLGIADLLERQLSIITDSDDGYVGFKQTSLQDRIDAFETQISQMEALLERKQEALINRFVRMETALSKLQNQGSWLASQLDALTRS